MRLTQGISLPVIDQLLALLHAILTTDMLNQIVMTQIKKLRHYFSELSINRSSKDVPATSPALDNLFWIEKNSPQDSAWINRMAEILTS